MYLQRPRRAGAIRAKTVQKHRPKGRGRHGGARHTRYLRAVGGIAPARAGQQRAQARRGLAGGPLASTAASSRRRGGVWPLWAGGSDYTAPTSRRRMSSAPVDLLDEHPRDSTPDVIPYGDRHHPDGKTAYDLPYYYSASEGAVIPSTLPRIPRGLRSKLPCPNRGGSRSRRRQHRHRHYAGGFTESILATRVKLWCVALNVVGKSPCVAITPDGNWADRITDRGGGSVIAYYIPTNSTLAPIPLGSSPTASRSRRR